MLESQPLDPNLIRLRQLVDASIRRDPGGESHIIANHMQQIEDLLIGQGVDFIPEQDPMGERSPFVQRFLNETNLQQYLPDIARKLMGSGEVLAWLRITPGGYRLRYYAKEEFKPYYSPDSDDLTAATILSNYTVELPQGGVQRKWLKMVVLRQGTFVEESDSRPRMAGIGDRPDLDLSQSQQLMQGDKPQGLGNEVRFYPNPFEFLPLAVLKNKPTGPGQRSADDFSEFARQLVAHDATMRAIGQNVRKYARQTIFTNLPRNQIMKGGGGEGDRRYGNSGSFASDYYDAQQSAARRMGGGMPGQEEEIADVIGADSMPGESFINVLTWNPIQGDQLQYLEILEDKLHWSMGSISKRGGGTAYEVRANLSWPTATANKKAHNLFDRGLCELIAGAIAHEETLYAMTGGLAGLTPAGPTRVKWRRVELVQPSPQDQLQTSILGRNLEEEGVGTPSILRLLFPDKTEQEIQAMTGGEGGVPFRKLEKTIPQLQAIYQTLMVLPPEIAMQLLPVTQLLTENLVEALNYGRTGTNPSPGPSADPAVIAAALSRVNPAGAAELLRATGHSDQLVSTDDQQPAGAVPSAGTTIGNPLSAFDRFRANFSGGLFSGAGRTP